MENDAKKFASVLRRRRNCSPMKSANSF